MDERLIDKVYEKQLKIKRNSIDVGELYEVPNANNGPIIERNIGDPPFNRTWPHYAIRKPRGMFTRTTKTRIL